MAQTIGGVAAATHAEADAERLRTVRFDVPGLPAPLVERPRVTAALDHARFLPLTLLSAPAGSGKTTAVAAWVARRPREARAAWLTLDRGDSRPGAVLPLAMECLARHGVKLPLSGRRVPPGDESEAVERAAAVLAQMARTVTLVVDGLEHAPVAAVRHLETLVRHSAGRLRLILLTRADPPLPLTRYRLEEALGELRGADLAFTVEETAALVGMHRLPLDHADVLALHGRTQGWAAALRFAVMHLQASDRPADAVRRLAGDAGNIGEYLMTEVLDALPPGFRRTLLRTSAVDILQPGLLEVLAGPSGPRTLATLARANVLVEELPDRPGWFRYHPLLRDLLRAELAHELPDERDRLHSAAASWQAQHGDLAAAVRTACEVEAWTDAARYVVDDLSVAQVVLGDPMGVARPLRDLPDEVQSPDAVAVRTAFALAEGRTCEPEALLSLGAGSAQHCATRSSLVLTGHVLGAVHAGNRGDAAAAAAADRALEALGALPRARTEARPEVGALLHLIKGTAQVRRGDLRTGRQTLDALAGLPGHSTWQSDWEPLLVAGLGLAALVAAMTRDPRGALELAAQSAAFAARAGLSAEDRPPGAELALAWVCAEEGDAAESVRHLAVARRSRSCGTDPLYRVVAALVEARQLRAAGDPVAALVVLQREEHEVIEQLSSGWWAQRLRSEVASMRNAHGLADRTTRLLDDGFALVETLTPKETEVLGLMAELLNTQEIAATMFVSVNTVRTHVRSILRKLGSSRRNDAIRRARALRLLDT